MSGEMDPFEIEGIKRGRKEVSRRVPWVFLGLIGAAFLGFGLSSYPEKIRRKLGLSKPPQPVVKVVEKERVVEKRVEIPVVSEVTYYTPQKGMDVGRTPRGLDFKRQVVEVDGGVTTAERQTPGSYEANYTVTVRRPRAARSLEELEMATPDLTRLLPGLGAMLSGAKISPFFKTLYANKAKRIQKDSTRPDRILTKHNYYDCHTMLEMTASETGRRVFLLQGDMDVVADGSDGDRLSSMPDEVVNSAYYQPFTSYGWPKTGTNENPMIPGWRRRIDKARTELADPTTDSDRQAWLRNRIEYLKDGIQDMEKRSFLIAEYDPFIVIPVYIIRDRVSAWGPNVGDYAAVIYEGKVYPAIVGDGGPSHKVGEASLRVARTINANATPNIRPVSSVGVTYLVFPRTSIEKWAAPDYELWHRETARLLEEIGGLGEGVELHRWENLLPES